MLFTSIRKESVKVEAGQEHDKNVHKAAITNHYLYFNPA